MHIRVTNRVGVVWYHLLSDRIDAVTLRAMLADLRKKLPENNYQFCWSNP